jgi:proteasome accessory factor A
LVLDLLELNCLPKTALADTVVAFRNLSHQPDGPWLVRLAGGHCADAVHLLTQYHQAANAELRGRDSETDVLLTIWGEVLAGLAADPETLIGRVDWITKRWLLRQFGEQEDIPWSHPWMKSQDLEYHQIDPGRSLGLALARTPPAWEIPAGEISRAASTAPANTRAAIRSQAMRLLQEEDRAYYIDWEIIGAEGGSSLHMLNPFEAESQDAEKWIHLLTETNGRRARRGKAGRDAVGP